MLPGLCLFCYRVPDQLHLGCFPFPYSPVFHTCQFIWNVELIDETLDAGKEFHVAV